MADPTDPDILVPNKDPADEADTVAPKKRKSQDKPFWESQVFAVLAGGLIAAFTAAGTSFLATNAQLKAARIQADTQSLLAHEAADHQRWEQQKRIAQSFVGTCRDLQVILNNYATDPHLAEIYQKKALDLQLEMMVVIPEFPEVAQRKDINFQYAFEEAGFYRSDEIQKLCNGVAVVTLAQLRDEGRRLNPTPSPTPRPTPS